MLRLFRNNLFGNLVWVVIFALAIKVLTVAFVSLENVSVTASSPLISPWLKGLHSGTAGLYISTILSFVLSLAIGLVFNAVVSANEVLYKQSYFPALFFFYLTHIFGSQTLLSPQLIAVIFCLLLVYRYLSLDPRNIKTTPFLDMGFFSAAAFCVLPETIFFIPALLIALIIAGYLTFKNFLLLLTGMTIPVYFIGIGYYLVQGNFDEYSKIFSFDFLSVDVSRFTNFSWADYSILGFIAFVLLLSVFTLLGNISKNTIRTRRALQLLTFFLIAGLASIFFSSSPVNQSLTLIALPLSPYLSYYFLKTKRAFWRETLFALFFIILIIAKIAMSM